MDYVAKQVYIKVIREMGSVTKREEKEERMLYLFEDHIRTKFHTFPLDEIMSISFKRMTGEGGILYIHTTHGVYSYQVLSNPEAFIKEVRFYLGDGSI